MRYAVGMKIIRALLLAGLAGGLSAMAQGDDLLSKVNILQGTDSRPNLSRGNTLPLTGAPWGMVDWSIENGRNPWFFRPDGKIDGFRATHQPSPWIGDYGQFVLMPQTGDLQLSANERMSEYDTNGSILRPDYERVEIAKGNITAELTATERAAAFRFTFHQGGTGRLILSAAGASEIKVEGRAIRGLSRANEGGVAGDFAHYFVIELDRDLAKSALFVKNKPAEGASAKGEDVSASLEFPADAAASVEVKVGTSLISWEQAEQNLKAEAGDSFDAVHARMTKVWESNLGRVEIEATDDQKKTFYSCLYRAQMFPHRLYEVNGSGKAVHYSPYDGKLHDGPLYGDIGIWDAFRTTFPFITIVYPAQVSEILAGFVNASDEGGTLPEWPSPGYRDCMIGQHCAAIFADAVAKNLGGFDAAKAYASLKKSAFEAPGQGVLVRRGLADYMKLGYIPNGASTYAVSATLDYAYDDWCVAQMAKQQNDAETYKTLTARAQSYRNCWDASVEFMHAKDPQGNWIEPFDQFAWGGPYAEGGPWQSSWFVPHDTAGLASLIGGPEKLASKLDEMLGLPPVFHTGGYGGVIHEMTEMAIQKFGQYDQGNQPGFDSLYLFAAIGQPWKTEYWTQRVCNELFNSGARGFPGDEDNGSMASWYLLSSIGLYSLCPGTPDYLFTSPLFPKVTLHLPDDKTFAITSSPHGEFDYYAQSRKLNGAEDRKMGMAYADIMKGGEMEVDLGRSPKMRAVAEEDLPYSASAEAK